MPCLSHSRINANTASQAQEWDGPHSQTSVMQDLKREENEIKRDMIFMQ